MAEDLLNYFERLLNEEQKRHENQTIKKSERRIQTAAKLAEYEGIQEPKKKASQKPVLSDRPLTINEKKNLSQLIR